MGALLGMFARVLEKMVLDRLKKGDAVWEIKNKLMRYLVDHSDLYKYMSKVEYDAFQKELVTWIEFIARKAGYMLSMGISQFTN